MGEDGEEEKQGNESVGKLCMKVEPEKGWIKRRERTEKIGEWGGKNHFLHYMLLHCWIFIIVITFAIWNNNKEENLQSVFFLEGDFFKKKQ